MYFDNTTPENRWKNGMFKELQETNRLLRKLVGQDKVTDMSEIKPKRQYNRRDKGVVNQ